MLDVSILTRFLDIHTYNKQTLYGAGLKPILNMKKGILLVIIFLVTVVGFIFTNAFIKSHQEYGKRYDFVITNIEKDAKGDLTFYDSLDNKYFFASYRFNEFNKLGISVGDKVFKDQYSKNMTISRKINNSYKIYYIQEPNGIIPFLFYSY